MDETLEAVRDSMIKGLGQLTDFFGFSHVMGHLYGALLMSPSALSLDEMEEIIGKSKASVSMNIRALERWGMVREVWVKGDRRKFYSAETDLWTVVKTVVESRERREVGVALDVLEQNAENLHNAQPYLDAEDRELADHYLLRVKEMQGFFRFAQLGLELLLAQAGPPELDAIATAVNGNSNQKDLAE